MQNVKRLV